MSLYKFQSQSIFFNAIITLLIGILLLSVPVLVVSVFVKVVGLFIGFSGLVLIGIYFVNKKRGIYSHPFYLSQGILNLILGLIMFLMPKLMIDFVFLIIGLWLLFLGIYLLAYVWHLLKLYALNKYALINGVFLIIISLFMIFNPYAVLASFLNVIGILLITLGLFMFFIAYKNCKIDLTLKEKK